VDSCWILGGFGAVLDLHLVKMYVDVLEVYRLLYIQFFLPDQFLAQLTPKVEALHD